MLLNCLVYLVIVKELDMIKLCTNYKVYESIYEFVMNEFNQFD